LNTSDISVTSDVHQASIGPYVFSTAQPGVVAQFWLMYAAAAVLRSLPSAPKHGCFCLQKMAVYVI
jgi:hypothetical protein